jgi:hypothetical protein
MQNNTKNGLLCIIIGMILSIISSIILFFSEGTLDIGIFSGLITLIGLIFMAIGRKEFGEKHRKFIVYAFIIFIINIIIVVIFVIIIVAALFSSLESSSSISSVDLSPVKNVFLMAPILAITGGIFNILLVHELEDHKGKNLLYLAFIVTLIISFYITVEGMRIADEWAGESEGVIEDLDDEPFYYPSLSRMSAEEKIEEITTEFQQKLSKISAVGIFGQILYLIAFFIPYNRIKSGELVPALPGHLKRCMNCGRVGPSDSVVCAYCGKQFFESQNYNTNYYQQNNKY